jgi:hypothetical protein
MASQSWGQLIAVMPIQGTLYNTFTTAKSLLTSTVTEASQGLVALPSAFFQRGSGLTIEAELGLSNIVTTPGTFALQVMVGAVIAYTTGNVIMTTTANTLASVSVKINLTCMQVGSSTNAKLMGQATLIGQNVAYTSAANNAAGTGLVTAPITGAALGTGFDSTIANTLDLFGAFSISNAGNGMQLNQYRVLSWGNTAV